MLVKDNMPRGDDTPGRQIITAISLGVVRESEENARD